MLKNIPDIGRKIKHVLEGELFVVILIILVGFLSFGLGRLSKDAESRVPVQILQGVELKASVSNNSMNGMQIESQNGTFVASKNGTKYHFPWCSGAQRIKEENKVWFSSKEEAERSGYTPAANCKGL